jgi:hypothetical protein
MFFGKIFTNIKLFFVKSISNLVTNLIFAGIEIYSNIHSFAEKLEKGLGNMYQEKHLKDVVLLPVN